MQDDGITSERSLLRGSFDAIGALIGLNSVVFKKHMTVQLAIFDLFLMRDQNPQKP